jgi:hypothetical protein
MTEPMQGHLNERMIISGDLVPEAFLPWISRHASKLGLAGTISHAANDRIDMMEMGCSLGPIDVWVETIERRPLGKKL